MTRLEDEWLQPDRQRKPPLCRGITSAIEDPDSLLAENAAADIGPPSTGAVARRSTGHIGRRSINTSLERDRSRQTLPVT
jgi:hypothetical protein